jgi:hypothetical protein
MTLAHDRFGHILRVLLTVLAAAAVYLASFALTRKTVILDFFAIDSPGKGSSIVAHYFSKNKLNNQLLYYFYFPVHAVIRDGDETLIERTSKKEVLPHISTIYVMDLSALE